MINWPDISLGIVLGLLAAHWIGDFLLQTNYQAVNKSKNNWALTQHVLTYTMCFAPFGWTFMGATFVAHWLTDWFTSRRSAAHWYIQPGIKDGVPILELNNIQRAWFWAWIGFDQLIHAITLIGTYGYIHYTN